MQKKIMIAFREGSENGGPYNSHLRIINSTLKEKYKFVPLIVPKGKMGLFNIKILKSLVGQIKAEKPDAVQIIGLEMIGYYLALSCRLAHVKKVIIAIHGSASEAIAFNKNPLKKWLMEKLEIFTLKTGMVTYGVSEYVYSIKNVSKYSKHYFGAIYNMLLNDEQVYERQDIRSELGISNNAILVVSTGRLIQEKGFDVFTDIIKNYRNNPDVVFVIAGDGNYKANMEKELKTQISNHQVFLLGYRSDISRILSGGDIFVMPSYHETLCMSLIEAGQKQLAMIASNVGGMKEIIDHDVSGYLAEVGNADSFCKYIDELIRNPKLLNTMKDRAYQSTMSKFSNQIAVEKLDSMYSELLGE